MNASRLHSRFFLVIPAAPTFPSPHLPAPLQAPTGADKLLPEVHGPQGLLREPRNAGMGGEGGDGESLGWKPQAQQPEDDTGGGVQAPRDCSGIRVRGGGVRTLKAIQNKARVPVSSDVTANH